MTVSIDTTRLSSVMTGCGGNDTTCSRRSIMYRTRSTNGTTTLRPAGRLALYFPNRSTIPARACGTMRTVLASTATTKTTTRISTTSAGCMVSSFSVPSTNLRVETRYLVHERCRALDLQYVDPRARFDDQVLVVRTGGPQLAVDAHPAAVGGHPLDHERLPPDQGVVTQHQGG